MSKISVMPAAGVLDGTEMLPLVKASANVAGTTDDVKRYVRIVDYAIKTADFTLAASDNGTDIWCDVDVGTSTHIYVTLPENAVVPLPIGFQCRVININTSEISFEIHAGGSINGILDTAFVIDGNYSWAVVTKIGTDAWHLATSGN